MANIKKTKKNVAKKYLFIWTTLFIISLFTAYADKLTLNGNSTTLTTGNYTYTSINITNSGTLGITGTVYINVTGNVYVDNTSTISTSDGTTANDYYNPYYDCTYANSGGDSSGATYNGATQYGLDYLQGIQGNSGKGWHGINHDTGYGGAGGGGLRIDANNINLYGKIYSQGQNGAAVNRISSKDATSGGGGGSGGTILLKANNLLNLTTSYLYVQGGNGGTGLGGSKYCTSGPVIVAGTNGASGTIKLFSKTLSNTSTTLSAYTYYTYNATQYQTSNYTLYAYNYVDKAPINIFNATITSNGYNKVFTTTNGAIITDIFDNSTNYYNVTVDSVTNYGQTILNQSPNRDNEGLSGYNFYLYQSIVRFKCFEQDTNHTTTCIDNSNITASTENYLNSGTYTFDVSAQYNATASYYDNITTQTLNAKTNQTINVYGYYNKILNITDVVLGTLTSGLTCTYNTYASINNPRTISTYNVTNQNMTCVKEPVYPSQVNTLNTNLGNDIIYVRQYQLQLYFNQTGTPFNVAGTIFTTTTNTTTIQIPSWWNNLIPQTSNVTYYSPLIKQFNGTSLILVNDDLGTGAVKIALYLNNSNASGYTQYFEYFKSPNILLGDTLEIIKKADKSINIKVVNQNRQEQSGVFVRAYSLTSSDSWTAGNLIGQRLTDIDGTTYFKFDNGTRLFFVVFKEGFAEQSFEYTPTAEITYPASSPYLVIINKDETTTHSTWVAMPDGTTPPTNWTTLAIYYVAAGALTKGIATDYAPNQKDLTNYCNWLGECTYTLTKGTDCPNTGNCTVYFYKNGGIAQTRIITPQDITYTEILNIPTQVDTSTANNNAKYLIPLFVIGLFVIILVLQFMFSMRNQGEMPYFIGTIILSIITPLFLIVTIIIGIGMTMRYFNRTMEG